MATLGRTLLGDPAHPVALWGREADRRAAEREIAARAGAPRGWLVRAASLPADATQVNRLARALARESVLAAAPVVVDLDDVAAAEWQPATLRRMVSAGCRLVVSSTVPVAGLPADTVPYELPSPSYEENTVLWRSALGERATALNGQVEQIAGHFRMGADAVVSTAATATSQTAGAGPDALAGSLWEACRVGARTDLGGLAERREPTATWDDLVLPARETRAAARRVAPCPPPCPRL